MLQHQHGLNSVHGHLWRCASALYGSTAAMLTLRRQCCCALLFKTVALDRIAGTARAACRTHRSHDRDRTHAIRNCAVLESDGWG